MKKLTALVLVLMVALSMCSVSLAEENGPQTGSEFEKMLLKRGSLIIKEFIDCGELATGPSALLNPSISFQAATLTDVETGLKYYAVRMKHDYYDEYYNYGGESIGILDLEEIDSVIATLEYIKAHMTDFTDYTEIVYTANSGDLAIGAFKSTDSTLFIKFSASDTVYLTMSDIDTLISKLQAVQSELGK